MKKIRLFTTCILLTLLTGCGARSAKIADVTETDSISSVVSEQYATGSASLEPETMESAETSIYTVAEICNGFKNDDETLRDLYEQPQVFWVTIDGNNYYYYHTYPDQEWTPENVADYYRKHPYYWGDDPTAPYGKSTNCYLWTADYEHKFVANLKEDWLYIDGIKAAPLEADTYSMNPKDLIEAFQTREWSGDSRRYSDDFSTYVTIVPEYGILEYNFEIEHLSTEVDPEGLSYTGYANAEPWWKNTDYGISITGDSAYSAISTLKYPSNYGITRVDKSGQCSDIRSSAIWGIAYVDVPWDRQDTLLAVQKGGDVFYGSYCEEYAYHAIYASHTQDGLYAITNSGVELWRAGRLRQTWDLKITDDCYLTTKPYFSDSILVYTDGKIYELFDDGETEIILDHIISINPIYADAPVCFTLSDNGTLYACCLREKNEVVSREIAQNVVAADLSDEDLILYTDNSGKTYTIHDLPISDARLASICLCDDYKTSCLGESSIQKFKELYQNYETEHGKKGAQASFIEKITAAYFVSPAV